MWQNPSNNSTQYCLTFVISGTQGDNICLKDSQGNEISSFVVEKTYGVITISNSNIKQGETYNLYINGTSVSNIEANSIISSNNNTSNGNNIQMPGKGMRTRRRKSDSLKILDK